MWKICWEGIKERRITGVKKKWSRLIESREEERGGGGG